MCCGVHWLVRMMGMERIDTTCSQIIEATVVQCDHPKDITMVS